MSNPDSDKAYIDLLKETLLSLKNKKISLGDLNKVCVQMEKDWNRLFYPTPDPKIKNYPVFRLADELFDLSMFENKNLEFVDQALEIIEKYVSSNKPESMYRSDAFQKMISRRAPIGISLELLSCIKCGFEYPVPYMTGFEDLNCAWCQDCKHILFYHVYDPMFKRPPSIKKSMAEDYKKFLMEIFPKCKCGGSFTLFWSSQQCPSCGNKTFNRKRGSRYQFWQEGKASLLPHKSKEP